MQFVEKLKDEWTHWKSCWQDWCFNYQDEIMIAQLIAIGLLLLSGGFFAPWICSAWFGGYLSGMMMAFPCAIIFSFALYFAGGAQPYQQCPGDELGFGAVASSVANLFASMIFLMIMFLMGICISLGMLLYCLTMQGWIYFFQLILSWLICIPLEGFLLSYGYVYYVLLIRKWETKQSST